MTFTAAEARQLQANIKGKKTEKVKVKKPKMNGTETQYANMLDVLKRGGQIFDYQFEPIKFKLTDGVTYTPDFMVVKRVYPNVRLYDFEFIEIKGFLRDDARIKFLMARKQFPFFKFKMIQHKQGSWNEIYPE